MKDLKRDESMKRITLYIDKTLLAEAEERIKNEGLKDLNDIIEKSLKLFFDKAKEKIWEKPLETGFERITIKNDQITKEQVLQRTITRISGSKKKGFDSGSLIKNKWKPVK
jgi:metal-responsive CopG/Arc/MetJ family transcriptional regulator